MSKSSVPPYPPNKGTEKITLPPQVEQELRQLVQSGKKIEAVQRVVHLTGAGLKISKDYVDSLERKPER
jgi:ribosomal protein L7/L12